MIAAQGMVESCGTQIVLKDNLEKLQPFSCRGRLLQ
jgi:hypothetical protein